MADIEKYASDGYLTYDHMGNTGYIFLEIPGRGPTVFAEIRGFGAGLPQDANAEKICRLWNEDYYRSAPCAACGEEYDSHSRQMRHCPGQQKFVFTTKEEAEGD
jgi:hypothetical protein